MPDWLLALIVALGFMALAAVLALALWRILFAPLYRRN